MKLCSLFLLLSCLALGGCSRVAATTALNADGSFSRTVTYTINDGMSSMSMPLATPGATVSSKPVSFHSLFTLPDKDPSYKITQQKGKDGERLLIVTKSMGAGSAPVQDIQLLSKDGKPDLQCKVAVQKLPNGNLQYDEEIKWVGPKPSTVDGGPEEMIKTLKPVIPERFRSDEKLQDLANHVVEDFMKAIFGPPRPVFAQALTNPDFMKLEFEAKLEEIFSKDAKREFPDISDKEISDALGWIAKFSESSSALNPTSHGPPDGSGDASLTPLTFVVTFPGKVVETDGIATKHGKVYWSMSAESATWFPVHLHLVVNPGG